MQSTVNFKKLIFIIFLFTPLGFALGGLWTKNDSLSNHLWGTAGLLLVQFILSLPSLEIIEDLK